MGDKHCLANNTTQIERRALVSGQHRPLVTGQASLKEKHFSGYGISRPFCSYNTQIYHMFRFSISNFISSSLWSLANSCWLFLLKLFLHFSNFFFFPKILAFIFYLLSLTKHTLLCLRRVLWMPVQVSSFLTCL